MFCDASLSTSIDPFHGTKQNGSTFQRSVQDWFNEKNHFDPYPKKVIHDCNSKSLTHRWYTIQEAVNEYCDYYKQLQNRRPSGTQLFEITRIFFALCVGHLVVYVTCVGFFRIRSVCWIVQICWSFGWICNLLTFIFASSYMCAHCTS